MDCGSIMMQVLLIVLIVMGVNVLIQFASLRNGDLRITYTNSDTSSGTSSGTSCGNKTVPAISRTPESTSNSSSSLHGYIISNQEARFKFASAALVSLNLTPHQHIPWDYRSSEVDTALQAFNNGSREFHTSAVDLKMFSNRMAHTELLQAFVDDPSAAMGSWRFFFEDDVAVHPAVGNQNGWDVLGKGMAMAAADGLLHLGICAPASADVVEVAPGILASRTFGYCSHGYGATKWRAAAMLATLETVKVEPAHSRLYFDVALRVYAEEIVRTWVLGVNLASPSPCAWDHFGIVYQDRGRFASFVNAPVPTTDNESTRR